MAIRPGISCSASRISLRPKSVRERSLTLKSDLEALLRAVDGLLAVAVMILSDDSGKQSVADLSCRGKEPRTPRIGLPRQLVVHNVGESRLTHQLCDGLTREAHVLVAHEPAVLV